MILDAEEAESLRFWLEERQKVELRRTQSTHVGTGALEMPADVMTNSKGPPLLT